jgi:hypothetical protein
MVTRVSGLGADALREDRPAERWLADWKSLIAARETFADDLAAGRNPSFRLPASDGVPITDRMNSVGLNCRVPVQLVDLH